MPRAKQYWSIQAATAKKKYTYNPVTKGTCLNLETYLTMINTNLRVMLGTITATITKVTYYNHT
jgi:arginine deiminase